MTIARADGLRGFYTAFLPTVARNTPTVRPEFVLPYPLQIGFSIMPFPGPSG